MLKKIRSFLKNETQRRMCMFIYNAVLAFNSWIWGILILIILIGGGLYLSFITGFVQGPSLPDHH